MAPVAYTPQDHPLVEYMRDRLARSAENSSGRYALQELVPLLENTLAFRQKFSDPSQDVYYELYTMLVARDSAGKAGAENTRFVNITRMLPRQVARSMNRALAE
jgi:hypothetical protein